MRFLSPEWVDGLGAATATAAAPGVSLSIHQRVTGGPDGDVEYTLRLTETSVSVEPGPGPADVDIVQDYETAAAIAQGRLTPAAAFAAGRLRLAGSISALVRHQEAVAALGPVFAASAEATTY